LDESGSRISFSEIGAFCIRIEIDGGGNQMKLIALVTMILVLAVPVLAADVDGKWTGNVATPNGDLPVSFTFKADGEKLTGSTMGLDGSDVAISDGKVDGKNITFKVTLDFGGMPFVLNYKGVVSPAEIKLTAEAAGMPMPFELLLKKAPATPAPAAK
jgi:hypothetical protein